MIRVDFQSEKIPLSRPIDYPAKTWKIQLSIGRCNADGSLLDVDSVSWAGREERSIEMGHIEALVTKAIQAGWGTDEEILAAFPEWLSAAMFERKMNPLVALADFLREQAEKLRSDMAKEFATDFYDKPQDSLLGIETFMTMPGQKNPILTGVKWP